MGTNRPLSPGKKEGTFHGREHSQGNVSQKMVKMWSDLWGRPLLPDLGRFGSLWVLPWWAETQAAGIGIQFWFGSFSNWFFKSIFPGIRSWFDFDCQFLVLSVLVFRFKWSNLTFAESNFWWIQSKFNFNWQLRFYQFWFFGLNGQIWPLQSQMFGEFGANSTFIVNWGSISFGLKVLDGQFRPLQSQILVDSALI